MHRYVPPKVPPKSHLRYFNLLTPQEQADSVRRLIASGMSDFYVGEITGLGCTEVRRIIGPR
jgi:hypothetical protein